MCWNLFHNLHIIVCLTVFNFLEDIIIVVCHWLCNKIAQIIYASFINMLKFNNYKLNKLKQKRNKLNSSLNVLVINKKCPALSWLPAPFKFWLEHWIIYIRRQTVLKKNTLYLSAMTFLHILLPLFCKF